MPSRLKSIELQGYKTFASRTLFEFPGDITAIVGPNGSGKSNIADALRWVLGEQAFTLLRGRKTEDMIFSGSDQRPRAGMASATVVFDNDEGWLPIDFSEVSITRRAYRDGHNEYLINGQKMRLRDVSSLLAKSGLAERTYTVIGQGLVDAALSLRAEERRKLFEEAAGIGLYRSRRDEALRRLEQTQRNLERVRDILSELTPRLRSLERQARRSKEFEQVKDDLQLMLREWYGFHWHRSQRELRKVIDTADQQEKALDESRRKQTDINVEVKTVRETIQTMRSKLSEWHASSAQLHSERERISRQLAVAEERNRALLEQISRTEIDVLQQEETFGFRRDQIEEIDKRYTQLKTDFEEAQKQADEERQKHSAHLSNLKSLEQQLETGRSDREKLLTSQAESRALHSEMSNRKGILDLELERIDGGIEEVSKELTEVQTEYEGRRKISEIAEKNHKKIAGEIDRVQSEQAQSSEETERLRQEHLTKQSDMTRMQARIDVLVDADNEFIGYHDGAQILLEAAKKDRISGSLGTLSSFLDIPKDIEVAIAAALGEYTDAFLLSDQGDTNEVLDLLTEQQTRGTILPLERLGESDPLSLQKISGSLGIASDMVDSPDHLKKAVDILLGRVLIVKDRKTALVASKKIPANSCVVTLNGEVFYASGQIRVDSVKQRSTLSRPRELKDIQKSVQSLTLELEAIETEIQKHEDAMQNRVKQLAELAKKSQDAQQEVDGTTEQVRESALKLDKVSQEHDWWIEQKSSIQKRISEVESEFLQSEQRLLDINTQIEANASEIEEVNAKLAEFSIDESLQEIRHWDREVALLEQALEDVDGRRNEHKREFERLTAQFEAAKSDLEQARGNLLQHEEEKEKLQKEEKQIAESIEALNKRIEPAEVELRDAESRQEELLNEEMQTRDQLNVSERHHTQAQISLARQQQALETLRNRIEDDFGLVAFEYADHVSGPTPLPFDGLVEQLPQISEVPADLEHGIKRKRAQLRRMGAVNPEAEVEYDDVQERHTFLTNQMEDLVKASNDMREVIAELNILMEREFRKTFDGVASEFSKAFTRLFNGGSAQLTLTDPDDLTTSGIEIEARLPGRRTQGLSLLSGGERSLTATALIFALLNASPTPFCLLDEVDAMLDEENIGRFRDMLTELSENTQFVLITHNRGTVQVADIIYGITLGSDSTSQVLSLKIDEVSKAIGEAS